MKLVSVDAVGVFQVGAYEPGCFVRVHRAWLRFLNKQLLKTLERSSVVS